MPDYHHMVIDKATPNVEFTRWCATTHNHGMPNEDAEHRRENLRRLIQRDYGGNQSAFARKYWQEIEPDKTPRPSYISDLIRPGSEKSFAEKAARSIEKAAGLLRGELDIPKSPLRLDPSRATGVAHEIKSELDDLENDVDLQREVLAAVRMIKARYRKSRRKAG